MPLTSISPIDGRYAQTTAPLAEFFSEQALMRYRLIVETEYLIALSEVLNSPPARGGVRGGGSLRILKTTEIKTLRALQNLNVANAQIISNIEKICYKSARLRIPATNHDVKAVEYYLKLKLKNTSLKDILEWIHFGLTSEDVNNIAYSLMLRDALNKTILPEINSIVQTIELLSKKYARLPMLARTHGQSASPTTFGKEMKNFTSRLKTYSQILKNLRISCKINGATGNYNAHTVAFPKINWIKFSQQFISGFNNSSQLSTTYLPRRQTDNLPASSADRQLTTNLHTTQIEPHDSYIELFDCLKHINTILIDFNQDIWRYISDGWIKQKTVKGEIGSSTMPHKVNPINFENSEGNLGLANALFQHFANKLPISRLQRDLSDSTVQRNFGTAFSHSLIAYNYLLKGLARIEPDEATMLTDLNAHPEVLAEALQTILRREGVKMPYEKLKALTRGASLSLNDIYDYIETLDVSVKVKQELKNLTPENYIGLAAKLTTSY